MLTVEGIYKDGKVELLETVSDVKHAKVLVTFLENGDIDLQSLGIDETEAKELREKFASFEDWNDPALDVYNDYDNAKRFVNWVLIATELKKMKNRKSILEK